jgi:hypothetical protein
VSNQRVDHEIPKISLVLVAKVCVCVAGTSHVLCCMCVCNTAVLSQIKVFAARDALRHSGDFLLALDGRGSSVTCVVNK